MPHEEDSDQGTPVKQIWRKKFQHHRGRMRQINTSKTEIWSKTWTADLSYSRIEMQVEHKTELDELFVYDLCSIGSDKA